MLNLSGFCHNSKDLVVRNLAEEDDNFEIPTPKFPLSTESSISKLPKPSSSNSTKPSISKSSEPSPSRAKKASENALESSFLDLKDHTKLLLLELSELSKNMSLLQNYLSLRIEKDKLGIVDHDTVIANDSAKDTKVNKNGKKDNDGGDIKSAAATDSSAKRYTEDKDTDGENHTETIVNKDKESDVVQDSGDK
ncbi:hypothetical protein PanWU01x14_030700, partial [Parasponia andersonii]